MNSNDLLLEIKNLKVSIEDNIILDKLNFNLIDL